MQVGFADCGVSSRVSGTHAKLSSHLPISPSKVKPSLSLGNQKSLLSTKILSMTMSDLQPCMTTPSFDAMSKPMHFSALASPPRTPLSAITNTCSCSLGKLHLTAMSMSSIHTPGPSALQPDNQPCTRTPAPCTPEVVPYHAIQHLANRAQHHQQATAQTSATTEPPMNVPEARKEQKSPASLLASPHSAAPVLCSTPAPVTPQIVDGMLSYEQLHISEESSSSDADSEEPDQAQEAVRAGEIHLFVGPMFAGKSTSLLNSVRLDIAAGRSVATIKSHKDDRYANNFVVTHNGDKEKCFAVPTLRAFKEQVPEAYLECDVIAIDEGQFFSDLFEFSLQAADQDGKIVYIAGLDGDFKRQKFGSVLDLIPFADTVTKLHSRCAFCSRSGLFSLRISADMRQEVVGGSDQYRPVCRQHYLQLSSARTSNAGKQEK